MAAIVAAVRLVQTETVLDAEADELSFFPQHPLGFPRLAFASPTTVRG